MSYIQELAGEQELHIDHITDIQPPLSHLTHKVTVLLLASALNLITICEQWIMSFFCTVRFTLVFWHLTSSLSLPFSASWWVTLSCVEKMVMIYCKMLQFFFTNSSLIILLRFLGDKWFLSSISTLFLQDFSMYCLNKVKWNLKNAHTTPAFINQCNWNYSLGITELMSTFPFSLML